MAHNVTENKDARKKIMQLSLQQLAANTVVLLSIFAGMNLMLNWISWDTDKYILLALIACSILALTVSWRIGKEAMELSKKHPDILKVE